MAKRIAAVNELRRRKQQEDREIVAAKEAQAQAEIIRKAAEVQRRKVEAERKVAEEKAAAEAAKMQTSEEARRQNASGVLAVDTDTTEGETTQTSTACQTANVDEETLKKQVDAAVQTIVDDIVDPVTEDKVNIQAPLGASMTLPTGPITLNPGQSMSRTCLKSEPKI